MNFCLLMVSYFSFRLLDSFSNLHFCPFLLASFKPLVAACQKRELQLPQELSTSFLFPPFTLSAVFFFCFVSYILFFFFWKLCCLFSWTWSYVGFTWYFLQEVSALFYLVTANSPTLIFFITLWWYWNHSSGSKIKHGGGIICQNISFYKL